MATKIQRWIDLLAALLRRHGAISFEELSEDVPAYQGPAASFETRRKMFERDKDELRTFGVPIQTVPGEDDQLGYRLDRKQFYLPYLEVLRDGRTEHRPDTVDKYGYRGLPTLAFDPDELQALQGLVPRLQTLGVTSVLDDARSALRKLGADLPLSQPGATPEATVPEPTRPAVDKAFDTLAEALEARKRVTFTYHSLNSRTTAPRTVEPYGLFFLGHAWYLAGVESGEERVESRGTVKNFRLSRMSDVSVSRKQPCSPDYEIPAAFDLREHARSREAWQLGSADVFVAVVEVTNHNGAARALTRLGEPVEGAPTQRAFRVRRMDTFARWLLSFAGSAAPLSPPALVERYRGIARETLALYEGAA
jgi:proteasome accessory factor B